MTTDRVLILRTCKPDMTSYDIFQWSPEVGAEVEAPDWTPEPVCGNGLHGLLWGEGNGYLLNWNRDAKWLVVSAEASEVVDLGGRVKFPCCRIEHVGNRQSATEYIARNGGAGRAIVGATATAGDYGTATTGDFGTATAGDYGTAIAGVHGATSAGHYSTAIAGYWGAATAGDYGIATAGNNGTATAGDRGTLIIRYDDGWRMRTAIAYVGENGIKPNTPYRVDSKGNFIEVGDTA